MSTNQKETNIFSPADLLSPHVKQDVSRGQAKGYTINEQGTRIRDKCYSLHRTDDMRQCHYWDDCSNSFIKSYLGLLLAEVWQCKWWLWVDKMVVDVSLGGHKHQTTANTKNKIKRAN